MWNSQALTEIERKGLDLTQSEPPPKRSGAVAGDDPRAIHLDVFDVEIGPFIQTLQASSITEIEQLMAKLQSTKDFLQAEGDRVHSEAAHYMNLAQTASTSIRIIFDTVHGWSRAGHPVKVEMKPDVPESPPSHVEQHDS
jgi:hypothetical protein